MADAKKCDRCGDFYEMNERPILSIKKEGPFTYPHIDLCPQCLEELKQWLLSKNAKIELWRN